MSGLFVASALLFPSVVYASHCVYDPEINECQGVQIGYNTMGMETEVEKVISYLYYYIYILICFFIQELLVLDMICIYFYLECKNYWYFFGR